MIKTEEQQLIYDNGMRLVEAVQMQSIRLLRTLIKYHASPDALTRSDVEFESKQMKALCKS